MSAELREAVIEAASRVLAWVEQAMDEHPCCYDPATAPEVVAGLLSPITDALPDQKEG